ncbi:MAG: hypothetical protein IJE74_00840 [Clostridia bacterium]|nr:hypothetical protein [Clostridia bacterium]
MEYIAPIFASAVEAKDLPAAAIDSFMWDTNGCKPESYASMFAVKGEGIHALLWSFEENIRCECTRRDDPVYTDSCLELFLMPVDGDNRYINFEVNSNGVYLSQIGTCREDRVFIKELIDLEPVIYTMKLEEDGKKAWGYEIILSEKFISTLYQTDFKIQETSIKGNFYKCADSAEFPHYGAHFPVKTQNPDFHRPEFFGKITFRKV